MKQIPLTQGQCALVDDQDFEWLTQWKWFANWCRYTKQFRASRAVHLNRKKTQVLMHRQIVGFPENHVDHKNLNALDNRRSNLRVASPSQNHANAPLRANNSSGFKGVYWSKQHKKWRSKITVNYKTYELGCFSSIIEAALAYDKAALKFFEEFARLNFPLVS